MIKPTPRVIRLREHALAQKDNLPNFYENLELISCRVRLSSYAEPWMIKRHALETASILRNLKPVIGTDELIVGKYDCSPLTTQEAVELHTYQEQIKPATEEIRGIKAHMSIDFEDLLRQGVSGITKRIEVLRSRLDVSQPEYMEKDAFYEACLLSLSALVEFAHHYAAEALDQAERATDAARKAELEAISAILNRVPEFPAQTFYEAIEAAHFVTFALCAGCQTALFQYGRPDRYLYPYYLKDLQAGKITAEKALELIDCLGIMLTEYTQPGLAIGWMIGGKDATGKDVCNDLTRLFLESIGHVHLSYPDVGFCWSSDTPGDSMDLAASLLGKGYSQPALFNDDVITNGLNQLGLPLDEACLYQNSTCVEITPIACSNVYVASPYINLVQILQDLLFIPPWDAANGKAEADEIDPKRLPQSFDALIACYRQGLSQAVRQAVVEQNIQQMTRYYFGGQPLLSCFVNDCLRRGLDIDQGGARYNWIEPSFVGLSNLIDSLESIRQVVFEEKMISLKELALVLQQDFAGNENLRQLLLNRVPKYGNDQDTIDAMAIQVTGWIEQEVKSYRSYLGDKFVSGFFTWIMHERLGSVTAATADGRHAGFPLSAGAGASQGCEKEGPTAAVLSATKWNHTPHLGGIAVNLKFNRPRDDEFFDNRLREVVETYLKRGGFEVQVNVVDRSTLLAAQKAPESYRDLVVRIGGYSDYFVRLSPEMQAEIIQRSEHDL